MKITSSTNFGWHSGLNNLKIHKFHKCFREVHPKAGLGSEMFNHEAISQKHFSSDILYITLNVFETNQGVQKTK